MLTPLKPKPKPNSEPYIPKQTSEIIKELKRICERKSLKFFCVDFRRLYIRDRHQHIFIEVLISGRDNEIKTVVLRKDLYSNQQDIELKHEDYKDEKGKKDSLWIQNYDDKTYLEVRYNEENLPWLQWKLPAIISYFLKCYKDLKNTLDGINMEERKIAEEKNDNSTRDQSAVLTETPKKSRKARLQG